MEARWLSTTVALPTCVRADGQRAFVDDNRDPHRQPRLPPSFAASPSSADAAPTLTARHCHCMPPPPLMHAMSSLVLGLQWTRAVRSQYLVLTPSLLPRAAGHEQPDV
jgi:hypothetical protein